MNTILDGTILCLKHLTPKTSSRENFKIWTNIQSGGEIYPDENLLQNIKIVNMVNIFVNS